MSRPSPFRVPAAVAILAALVVGCEAPEDRPGPDDRPVAPAQEQDDLESYLGPPVGQVTIQIDGCGTDSVHVAVEPWQARIVRGRPFSWVISGDMDSVEINHKAGDWPFPESRFQGGPDRPIQAGNPAGRVGQRGQYDIVARCDGRVLVIDPELMISW